MPKQDYMNQEDRRNYQWPASALTGKEMEILNDWRTRTGTPISHLLRQAILKCNSMITFNREG